MAPVIVFIMKTISGRLRVASRNSQRAMGDITQVIEESVTAHKVVKLLADSNMNATALAARLTGCAVTP